MRKFLLAALAIAMTPALVPAAASAHAGPSHLQVQALHREVVQDRHELRHDRRELQRDRRQLHRARVARAQHRHWIKHHRRHHRFG